MAKPDKAIKAMKTTLVAVEYNINKAIACMERAANNGQMTEEALMAYQTLEQVRFRLNRLFESPRVPLSVNTQGERAERDLDQFLANLKQLLSDPIDSRHVEAMRGLEIANRIDSIGVEFASWLTNALESAWIREGRLPHPANE